MQVSRETVGGEAVMVLTVDASASAEVLERIAGEVQANVAVGVDLV
jgi:hypothetical protein